MAALVGHGNMTGSTLQVVTLTFAKTLPKKLPKGGPSNLTATAAGVDVNVSKVIKEKLSPKGRNKLVIIVKPNLFSIFPGSETVLNGEIDENVLGHFTSLGPYRSPWISLKAEFETDGVFEFNLDVQ